MYCRLTVICTPAMARELLLGYVPTPAMGPYPRTGSKLWSQMSWDRCPWCRAHDPSVYSVHPASLRRCNSTESLQSDLSRRHQVSASSTSTKHSVAMQSNPVSNVHPCCGASCFRYLCSGTVVNTGTHPSIDKSAHQALPYRLHAIKKLHVKS
jgi:hypothetical protein